MGAHQSRVHAADADRVDVQIAADSQNPGVDQAVEHHRGHVDGFLIGDAPPCDHSRRHAQCLGELSELRAAAVHHHDPHAEVMEHGDLLDQDARRGRVAEHAAAGLDDERLALVHADVGSGALQRPDGERLIASMQDHVDLRLL